MVESSQTVWVAGSFLFEQYSSSLGSHDSFSKLNSSFDGLEKGVTMKRKLIVLTLLAILIASGTSDLRQTVAARSLIATNGNRLVRPDGGFLFLMGANYVGGTDRSWTMWQN